MLILIMGVSGSGKTTVGQLLAQRLAIHFIDADDFHSISNRQKMARGIALNDEDRAPWLQSLADRVASYELKKMSCVLACSALKKSYREQLLSQVQQHFLVCLHADSEVIKERLSKRQAHFVTDDLLPSQLATLDMPSSGEALVINVERGVSDIVDEIEMKAMKAC